MQKVKTSKHKISNLNKEKSNKLALFLKNYNEAVQFYINYLWNNKISIKAKDNLKILDIKNDLLDCPQFISTTNIEYKTDLSKRVLKVASTQACSIVKSALEKRKRKLFVLNKFKNEGKRTRKLTNLLKKEKLVKPNPNNILPAFNSLCSKVEKSNIKHFDSIFILSSIGKSYGKIIIPFNHNKHSRKLESNGKLLSGLSVSKNCIYLFWEIKTNKQILNGKILGADTGINSVVTLSDGQQSKNCPHGHSLNSILKKISRKKNGSKAFNKALDHRNNYINWAINKLNFNQIKEVKLEKISNFRQGKNIGKFLNYFGETIIREKLLDRLSELGVQVTEESSAFRSQRCSHCGFVYSKNRNGKSFSCKHCSFQADADLNASLNHEKYLPSATFLLYHSNKPKKFFWKEDGFFDLNGSEITVSNTKKNKI